MRHVAGLLDSMVEADVSSGVTRSSGLEINVTKLLIECHNRRGMYLYKRAYVSCYNDKPVRAVSASIYLYEILPPSHVNAQATK